MSEVPPLTVSALAGAIEGVLRESFPYVAVVGEVGKVTLHGNGHLYLDLKDENAVINAVMWRDAVAKHGTLPKLGDSVVAHGKITTYKMRSNYQLQVFRFEAAGVGTLLQQVEALKAKLQAEGVFESARKRPLPMLPRKIGLITSPTGAVLHDIMTNLRTRCPVPVVLWPATVQGATAAAEVVKALHGFNALQGDARPDVIIIARGGGSMEDLMPFNDETLVRAVAASGIPTISAIGHEPDVTLCDFAADVRAPTPSLAAQAVVPVRAELLTELVGMKAYLHREIRNLLALARERVGTLRKLLPEPNRLLAQARLRLDDNHDRMGRIGADILTTRRLKLDNLARVLAAHRPLAPLERGFALVRNEAGQLLRSKDSPAGNVLIHFADGPRKGTLS